MDSLILIIAIGAAVAGFVQGLSGFAFSMVAMSFWAWTVDPKLAAALAVFGSLTGQLIAAISMRRGFDFRLLLPFLLGGLVGIPIGAWLLPHLDARLFKFALGSLLVIWCPIMLFSQHLPKVTAGGRVADGAAGLAGGILGGLGGFTGAVPTLWCTLRQMEKDKQRSIVQNFNLAALTVTMLTYIVTGAVTVEMLPMFAVVAPAMLIPALIGMRVYIGLSEAAFRKVVLGALTASGVALLASSISAFLRGMP